MKATKRQLEPTESESILPGEKAGKPEKEPPAFPAGWGLHPLTYLGMEHSQFWGSLLAQRLLKRSGDLFEDHQLFLELGRHPLPYPLRSLHNCHSIRLWVQH